MVEEAIADHPSKSLNGDKMTVAFLAIVNSSWTVERIADLERRLDAMDAAPIPAPAKRVRLKLEANSYG